jgi:hypothetical protein
MPTVQPVTTLNVDNTTYNVADLSQAVQTLVSVYNDWNQELANAQSKYLMAQAALNDLQRQIITQLKADLDAAATAANDAPAATDTTAPAATDTTAPAPTSVN